MWFSSSPSTGFRSRRWPGILLALPLALCGCREQAPVILSQFEAFGTRVDVNLVGVSRDQARQASTIVAQDFAYLQQAWTATDSGHLARVNRRLGTGQPFVAPPALLPLIRLSQTYESQSGGLFNPAIGKLTNLWGFDRNLLGGHPPPTSESIARLVAARPRIADIAIEGLYLKGSNPAVELDFSAIAKGYAIDLAMHHLMDLGVRNALIQAGGDLRAIGERSGQPWRIPILRPSGSGVFAMIAIRGDESLVTTADYDRNFIFKGTLYHAILDPRTGWPAAQTRSVTVIHSQAAGAAAAANALFVAGPDAWQGVAAAMDVRYVMLVDAAGRVQMTQAMADRLELVDTQEEILIPGTQPLQTQPLASGAIL
ncbi:FAD:protein FMN transferase [Thiocystis violacea]|uniref:FAD:protein FMN transferase n=1 Tax=Thiocystis violacea TaxID=13725 RepID=UPI0019050890|nr:FAD:protein FMN transferase [Thiocystis violacea]MBK1723319.1 thiamine biosynthesis protein ApbE [Thiocystis violacea]